MYHHILKRLPLFVAVVLLLLPARPQNSNSRDLAKLDLLLRQAVAEGSDDTRRVIVRVDADSRAGARERLEHRGARVYAEHPSIDAFSAVVHLSDLAALAHDQRVLSVSTDAVVGADQTLVYDQTLETQNVSTSSTSVSLLTRDRALNSARNRCRTSLNHARRLRRVPLSREASAKLNRNAAPSGIRPSSVPIALFLLEKRMRWGHILAPQSIRNHPYTAAMMAVRPGLEERNRENFAP